MSMVLNEKPNTPDMFISEKTDEMELKIRKAKEIAFYGLKSELNYDRCTSPGMYVVSVKLTESLTRVFYPIRVTGGLQNSGIGFLLHEVY